LLAKRFTATQSLGSVGMQAGKHHEQRKNNTENFHINPTLQSHKLQFQQRIPT
jgi:ribosomal protein L35